jgi:hypothetical protein
VAPAVKRASDGGAKVPLLVFDDGSGRVIDLDLRGTEAEVLARLSILSADEPAGDAGIPASVESVEAAEPGRRRRGRPRLGVVAREVTLLPRHWEWLGTQPGGASVMLRRLVDQARRAGAAQDRERAAREAAYRFMHAVAGDLPGFEGAARALFSADGERFGAAVAGWPADVREHALALAFPAPGEKGGGHVD